MFYNYFIVEMPAPIESKVKAQVNKGWLSGITRDEIAANNGISTGAVSNIIDCWKKELADSEYKSIRELVVFSKTQGLSLRDVVSHIRLYSYVTKLGADHDEIESLIDNLVNGANSIPIEKIADLTNQLFGITKSESIDPTDLLTCIKQKKEEKLRLEEELRQAVATLESKNVNIQTIEKFKHLENEFNTVGLSIEDAHILVSILKTIRQIGYDPQKIIREFMQIKSLRHKERQLEENCKILESRISRCREILPLCEQIMNFGIGFPELVAFLLQS